MYILFYFIYFLFVHFCFQQSSSWPSDQHLAESLCVTDCLTDLVLHHWTVHQLTPWMSRSQRPPLLPRSRLTLLERNRGLQHVPYARQGLQRRRTVPLRPQSCYCRLGSVTIASTLFYSYVKTL